MHADIHALADELPPPAPSHAYYRLRLSPAAPHSARRVRRIVRAYLTLWGMPSLTDAAELGVTELLTNVIRHTADRRCAVVLRRRTDGIRIEVHDSNPTLPTPCHADDLDTGGRGLAILALYAYAWNAEPTDTGGKVIWFDLRTDPDH